MFSNSSRADSNDGRRAIRVGKYEVIGHIATGGMGAVYRALDLELGREVALKILPPELAVKPALLERFRREAHHAARLRHDNIVTLYEFGEAAGTHYLAMELVDGIDLHEYIRRKGHVRSDKARHILIQAAKALDHAHQQGIVHRDIKPSNFLVTRHGGRLLVKLTDLGLAREAAEDEFRVTRVGTTVGSIDYMAPEQARDSGAADIRSDLYSLGCTFHHMLTGKPPFAEGSLTERLFKHLEAEPPDVRAFNPQVPDDLLRILARLLAKKPAERYQTPAELLQDLVRRARPSHTDETGSAESIHLELPAASAPHTPLPAATATLSPRDSPPEVSSFLLPSATPEQHRVAAGQFERANEVLALGNVDYSLQLLQTCCRLDPSNATYRKALRQVVQRRQKDRPGWAPLAWLSSLVTRARLRADLRRQDYVRALARGEEILAHYPFDVSTQLALAEAADGLGLLELAVWMLEEARRKEPRSPLVHRTLARLYEKRGDLNQAIALWDQVRKLDPQDGEASQKLKDLAASETIQRGRYLEETQRCLGEGT